MLSLSSLGTYPYSCNPDDVMGALQFQRKQKLFLDVMCKGQYPGYVKRTWREEQQEPVMLEGDLELIRNNPVDYIAFSYYRSAVFKSDGSITVDTGGAAGVENPYLEGCSPEPWRWPIDPKGIRYVCNLLNDEYGLPLFIVENGIGLDENLDENGRIADDFRRKYVKDHLVQVNEAILDGCNLMGYLYWGPIDVVSAGTGEMRKPFYWYKHIIETNGAALFE